MTESSERTDKPCRRYLGSWCPRHETEHWRDTHEQGEAGPTSTPSSASPVPPPAEYTPPRWIDLGDVLVAPDEVAGVEPYHPPVFPVTVEQPSTRIYLRAAAGAFLLTECPFVEVVRRLREASSPWR